MDYKNLNFKKLLLNSALVVGLMVFGVVPAQAGVEENRLTQAAINEVESVSKKVDSLSTLGRKTLKQSAVVLDLGETSLPMLLRTLGNRQKNWRLRYWVADMLGYVGNAGTANWVLGTIRNRSEYKEIRLKACDSLVEIATRAQIQKQQLVYNLQKMKRYVNDREVLEKIETYLSKFSVKS